MVMGSLKNLCNKSHAAIAMIELIFAIVVIGITLLSAPMILQTSIKSTNIGMQQEAIAATGSELGMILTRHWDESDSNATTHYGILAAPGGDTELAVRDLRSRTWNTTLGYTQVTPENRFGIDLSDTVGTTVVRDDMDDFNGLQQAVTLYAGETASLANNEGEYIDTDIYLTTQVVYGNDGANYNNDPLAFNQPFTTSGGASTNIKLFRVTLQTRTTVEELNKTISLSAFSCNIGVPPPNVVPMN